MKAHSVVYAFYIHLQFMECSAKNALAGNLHNNNINYQQYLKDLKTQNNFVTFYFCWVGDRNRHFSSLAYSQNNQFYHNVISVLCSNSRIFHRMQIINGQFKMIFVIADSLLNKWAIRKFHFFSLLRFGCMFPADASLLNSPHTY